MDKNKVLFIDIDTQNDFMFKEGKLYVPGAENIIENLKKLTEFAYRNNIPIFSSVDSHTQDDPEFKQFPPHCIKGTEGQKKINETKIKESLFIPFDRTIKIDFTKYRQFIFEKDKLSVFSNPNFERAIEEIGKEIFVVYGVATEYCVKECVEGLLERNKNVYIVVDAIKSVDEKKGKKFLEYASSKGISLIKTAVLLKKHLSN
ncbi:cysteine hydrolase [bacterium]|nr:cysteine hydrolase [bacterium]